ncbi:uncharacterized protein G2W53_044435 [Senna tora]|uniref:Uncharacterized protein n=1 Tax=Senna tora TaxID=362788 RepID=A0A834VXU5_9FABA|nr:uncharacterized protein G2W53_044435 [Senna tora]
MAAYHRDHDQQSRGKPLSTHDHRPTNSGEMKMHPITLRAVEVKSEAQKKIFNAKRPKALEGSKDQDSSRCALPPRFGNRIFDQREKWVLALVGGKVKTNIGF